MKKITGKVIGKWSDTETVSLYVGANKPVSVGFENFKKLPKVGDLVEFTGSVCRSFYDEARTKEASTYAVQNCKVVSVQSRQTYVGDEVNLSGDQPAAAQSDSEVPFDEEL